MEPILIVVGLSFLLRCALRHESRKRKLAVLTQQHLNQVYANSSTRKFKDEINNALDNTRKFIKELELVEKRLEEISKALHQLKKKLDQKLLCVEKWRIALSVASATVSTCASVVSAVLSAVYHEFGWSLAVSVVPMVMLLLVKGIDWKLHEVQSGLGKQKEVFEKLETGFALDKFNCIKELLEKLKIKINSRIRAAELAIEEEEEAALKAVMLDIKHNAKSVEDLENEIDHDAHALNTAITNLKILIY